jgi:hypothetical protein
MTAQIVGRVSQYCCTLAEFQLALQRLAEVSGRFESAATLACYLADGFRVSG